MGLGEEVISIYCSGDGASDPVQGAQGKTKYKKKKIEIPIQELEYWFRAQFNESRLEINLCS